jgi:hypothetical protein
MNMPSGDLSQLAFLARIRDGQIAQLWMVEAQPAHSDEFWARRGKAS